MTLSRALVLVLGPPILIGGAYAVSEIGRRPASAAAPRQRHQPPRDDVQPLAEQCRVECQSLAGQLPSHYSAIIRPPFALVGDCSEAELAALHRDQVVPVTEALWRSFFDRRPDRPILIVALSTDAAYRHVARRLDGLEPVGYAGYAQRDARRIVVNRGTGSGTLSHELAHLLAYFDFPDMPEWFDEGLAALHESTIPRSGGLTLQGIANARCDALTSARRSGELPSLTSVIRNESFRDEGEGQNYALVRSFCLFLQERGLLESFYRKFRARVVVDPTGIETLCELLGLHSDEELDREFEHWLSGRPPREAR